MNIRTHVVLPVAILSVVSLSTACTNNVKGSATPTGELRTTTTSNLTDDTPTTGDSSLDDMDSCDILDKAIQGKDFPPGKRDDVGSDNSCQTVKPQMASYSLTIFTDASLQDWPLDTHNSHEGSINDRYAIQEEKKDPPGCAVAIEVSENSFVDVMVTRTTGDTDKSCDLVTDLAEKVEPMLPGGE